jgi:release factor glutamine methyltransferase
MIVAHWLHGARQRLNSEEANAEAELLLSHVLACDRVWLWTHDRQPLEDRVLQAANDLLQRRLQGEPVAYLLGSRGFWTLDLQVTSDVLIPRPETELLVELALAHWPTKASPQVLDLGTGSGAIALALAKEHPQAHIHACDISQKALQVARANAQRLAIGNVFFQLSEWFSAYHNQTFDLVVSNPPYLAQTDPHRHQGDLRFEPEHALVSGHDGLTAIRTIITIAPVYLNQEAWLMIEHGFDQGAAVRELFLRAGFIRIQTMRDVANHERVTLAQCR